jgi:hypothetical protein
MEDGKLADTQQCLGEIIRRAKTDGPQRVRGPDGDAFILSARDYKRFVIGFTLEDEGEDEDRDEAEAETDAEPMSFLEMMQRSPLAEAMRSGDWPWEWDDKTRDWVLPSHAVSP